MGIMVIWCVRLVQFLALGLGAEGLAVSWGFVTWQEEGLSE